MCPFTEGARLAGDAVPVGFQRQEYFRGFFRLAQDWFIIEFRLIIVGLPGQFWDY